jgi:thiamine-phosphate pyrophosphorylase
MPRPAIDLSLYLVIGEGDTAAASSDRDIAQVVAAAVRGGVTCVQLREKTSTTRRFLDLAEALKAALDPAGVPLIVNDRADVALAVGAAGLHLGQDDLPPALARRLVGPDMILGLSAGDLEEAKTVDPALVDYAGIGPAYATGTKQDAGAAIGREGVRSIRAAVGLPSVAIGGINAGNAADVMASGVEGIAVVSAIAGAEDPEAAARQLRAIVDRAKR